MKTNTAKPYPQRPIRGRILGRWELILYRARGADGGRRLLTERWAEIPILSRDTQIIVPAAAAAWRSASRVAKRESNQQRREELGNERAAKIQKRLEAEDRRKRAAEYRPDLNLTIRREWLDAILFRGKAEEYRAVTNPQCRRLWEERESVGHFPCRTVVCIVRAGYAFDSRAAAFIVTGIELRNETPHPEWGEPFTAHYALRVGDVVRSGSYREVKAWLAWHRFDAADFRAAADRLSGTVNRKLAEGSNHA